MFRPEENITEMEAAIKFQRLKQTGSARDYGSEFLRLSSKLSKETYLASLFFVGLKDEIQDRIYQLGALPTTYEDMGKKAIAIENQLYEERKQNGLCFNCGKQGHVARNCKTE